MRGFQCFGLIRTTGYIWSLLLGLLLLPSAASASIYDWSDGQDWGFSSAPAACESYARRVANTATTNTGQLYTYDSSQSENIQPGISQTCRYWIKNPTGGWYRNGSTIQLAGSGTSCPSGTEYNATTGSCDEPVPDPCDSTIGNLIEGSYKIGDIGSSGHLENPTDAPPNVCSSSCLYTSPVQQTCFRFTSENPAGAWCNFEYRGVGQSCDSGIPNLQATPPLDPSKSEFSDCTEKVTDAEGRIHYTCQTTSEFTDPGNMNCGSVNGTSVCYPDSPSPKHDSTTTDIEVTETPNPDGSSDTSTTTTTTKVDCSGVNSCTTTSTTSTTNVHTNPDGSKGPSSSTCSGADCPDSSGKTQDERQEEEQTKSSVVGEQCGTSVVCSGDAVQCAILRQQKDQRCQTEEWQKIDEPKLKADLESHFSGPEFSPLTPDPSGTFDFSNMIDTSSSISGSCPTLPEISFTINSQTHTVSFSDWISQVCNIAEWFGYLLVAFALWRAAEFVAGGMR